MSSTSDNCKDGASKSNDDGVCELEEKLQNTSVADISVCANCGKEGSSDNMNTCNKCKQVKYCNAVCKKVHKKKHKKDCEEHIRLAAEKRNEELKLAAEKHDAELFKTPPSQFGDCPICFLRMPILNMGVYNTCCGKIICSGCSYAPIYDNQGNKVDSEKCSFCRTPTPLSTEEILARNKKRIEAGDVHAIFNRGNYYRQGMHGYPKDYTKALELYHQAAELGHAASYCSIGCYFDNGIGMKRNEEKAKYYTELAAIKGDVTARHNLGIFEMDDGNMDKALKHHMIAVKCGKGGSLQFIKELYTNGDATKEDYMKALQLYQEYLGEIKSRQRDEAAAAREDYRYY